MLHFRKIEIKDLDYIYSHQSFRPLLLTIPMGKKFGILVEEDHNIKGGVTGYIAGQGAMIQEIRVKKGEEILLLEGLLRATIYILDRDDIKYIFHNGKMNKPLKNIGFIRCDNKIKLSQLGIRGEIIDNIDENSFSYLVVEDFFNHTCN